MGLKHTNFFANSNYEADDTQIIICKQCSSHLCLSSLILSDKFFASSGEAYLVDKLINYTPEPTVQETSMHTGIYLISMVRCHQCNTKLGWNYKKAYSYSETYKEGKFVIEKSFIKSIPNNSSTATLMENVKRSRRRSSAANSLRAGSISSELDEDSFHFEKSPISKSNHDLHNISFQDLEHDSDQAFLNRLGWRSLVSDKLEDIEDTEAIVDV
ncbi:hypothetical protein CAAN1_19S02696 [[Candida] anglica]|uniref:Yippee domain-containing protein n=1 Tax=[Candida] anglica TaxID=148631 RepID=A0ABP0E9R8_9ASCO